MPLVVSGFGIIDLAVAVAKAGAIGFLIKPALLDDITSVGRA